MMYAGLVAWGCAIAVSPIAVFAQSDPTFDVASVKPNKSPDLASSFRRTPTSLTITNYTLRWLIQTAYDAEDFHIAGGPEWTGSDRFDVDAKAGRAVTPAELSAMLRSLLAERFGLRIRNETVDGRLYHLVRSRSALGPNLRPSPVDCAVAEMRKDQTRCNLDYGFESLEARGQPLDLLVLLVASYLRTPVLDQTGLKGRFDYNLVYNRRGAPESPHPSIFTAVDEQLGLKLQERRGPVTKLVIDRVGSLIPD